MLETIIVLLVLIWLVGWIALPNVGSLIHILLVVAIVVVIIRAPAGPASVLTGPPALARLQRLRARRNIRAMERYHIEADAAGPRVARPLPAGRSSSATRCTTRAPPSRARSGPPSAWTACSPTW